MASATYGGRTFTVGDRIYFTKYWQNSYNTAAAGVYSGKYSFYATISELIDTGSDRTHNIKFTGLHNTSGTITSGGGYCTPSEITKGYKVKVTYNKNNSDSSSSCTASQTGYVGASLTGTASRPGYTFAGWYTAASGGSKVTTIPTDAKTYYAHWTAKKYTVTLNNQSATTAGTTSVSATYGSAMPSITKPTKTGYTFGGYYTSTGGSGTQYYTSSGASARSWNQAANDTLYAKWTAHKYTIAYNANGGTGTMSDTTNVSYGSNVNLRPNTYTRGNSYRFLGWSTNKNATTASYTDQQSVSNLSAVDGATVTLYAIWEQQYLPPVIENITCLRYGPDPNDPNDRIPDDEGTDIHVEFDWAVDSSIDGTNHATTVLVEKKGPNDSDYSQVFSRTGSLGSSDSFDDTSYTGAFDTDKTYSIRISITDSYGTQIGISAPQAQQTDFLSTAFFTMDFKVGGHGIGVGTPAPEEGLLIGMDPMVISLAGTIQMFAGSTAPRGWLICDGSAISRTDYAVLFNVIGTTYGTGDGSTTFNLPNFCGRTPLGVGTGDATDATAHTLGQKSGTETHTLIESELPEISGTAVFRAIQNTSGTNIALQSSQSGHFSRSSNSSTGSSIKGASNVSSASQNNLTFKFGSGGSHNNMQPYLGINFIICTGQLD